MVDGLILKNRLGYGNLSLSIKSLDWNQTIFVSATGTVTQCQIILALILFFVVVGILGNIFALVKISRKRTSNNGSYTLMLRCLMTKNIIALLGFTILTSIRFYLSEHLQQVYGKWACAGWVIYRFFGISAGCIAVVMSIGRYIAVNYPFYYYAHYSTSNINRNALIGLSFIGLVITFLPFFGYGIYMDRSGKCRRYREAKMLRDKAYAIFFSVFLILICIVIVTCNVLVVREIFYKGRSFTLPKSSRITPTFLSLNFVICWMPQIISDLTLLESGPKEHWLSVFADILVFLHFALEPFVYMKATFFLKFIQMLGIPRSLLS